MKTRLRIKAKIIRKNLEMLEVSKKLVELIRIHETYLNSENVMLFYPKSHEIDFRELLNDDKNFFLPRVKEDFLEVCPYKLGDKLLASKFNVLEPVTAPINPMSLDLIIVPALFVDKNGYRLGYGGGYYDRLLQLVKNSSVKTLCAMPKELLVEKLPIEDFDIPVDEIVII